MRYLTFFLISAIFTINLGTCLKSAEGAERSNTVELKKKRTVEEAYSCFRAELSHLLKSDVNYAKLLKELEFLRREIDKCSDSESEYVELSQRREKVAQEIEGLYDNLAIKAFTKHFDQWNRDLSLRILVDSQFSALGACTKLQLEFCGADSVEFATFSNEENSCSVTCSDGKKRVWTGIKTLKISNK